MANAHMVALEAGARPLGSHIGQVPSPLPASVECWASLILVPGHVVRTKSRLEECSEGGDLQVQGGGDRGDKGTI